MGRTWIQKYVLPAVTKETETLTIQETKGGELEVKKLESIASNGSKASTTICHDEESVFSPIEISISKDIKGSNMNLNAQITPFRDVSNTFDYKAVFEEH